MDLWGLGGTLADPEPFATLVVTFVDGAVVEYPRTRFQVSTNEPDPIKVSGTTVVIENDEQTITLLGVRSFKMEHTV